MKRIALFVLVFMILGCAQAAVSVRMDGSAALLTQDGMELVATGTYADIVPMGEDLFAATVDGTLYALMNEDGELLTQPLYTDLRRSGDLLLAERDGMWGLLAGSGAELGAFEYERIVTDGAGGFWALREEEEGNALYVLMAGGGAWDSGLRVTRIGAASGGLLPVLLESGRWGCCDASGRMAFDLDCDYIGEFISGRAAAVANGRYGVIDESGAWIIDPAYDYLEISPGGFILSEDSESIHLMDIEGNEFAAHPSENTFAALVGADYILADDEVLRVFDAEGALLETLAPDASVSEGLGNQLIVSEGMWGEACVRLLGTNTAYQNLYPLGTVAGEAVYACMEVNAARYMNDLLGETQISVDMDMARYGMVNAAGEQILPSAYVSLQFLSDGRFLARAEDAWQLIDATGKVYWQRVTQTEAPNF